MFLSAYLSCLFFVVLTIRIEKKKKEKKENCDHCIFFDTAEVSGLLIKKVIIIVNKMIVKLQNSLILHCIDNMVFVLVQERPHHF